MLQALQPDKGHTVKSCNVDPAEKVQACLCVDVDLSPHLPQSLDQLPGMPVDPQPHPVQEDFGCLSDDRGADLLQVLSGELLQKLHDRLAGTANTDVAHESQILHQATGMPFWSFSRTDHAPLHPAKPLCETCSIRVTQPY